MDVSSIGATSATITPPAGNIGDLIVVYAFRNGSATAPSLPAGYTNIDNTGGSLNAHRIQYKVATATTESATVFTNATLTVCHRIRGQKTGTSFLGAFLSGAGTGTTVTYSAITPVGNATSLFLSYCGLVSATALGTRSGATRDITQSSAPMATGEHKVNQGGSLENVTATGSGSWHSVVVEILPAPNSGFIDFF